MFPNESSSDEISETDAFIQNFKEDGLESNDVPERLAESQSIGFVCSNEVTSAATCLTAQLSSTLPTDQVPVLNDAVDRINERGVPVTMAAVSNDDSTPPHAAQMMSLCTTKQSLDGLCSNKKTTANNEESICGELWPSSISSSAAMTISAVNCKTGSLHLGADGRGIKQISTGCESCDCTHHHPDPSSKSEALRQVSLEKDGGEAGADLTSNLFSEAIFSVSVISSSSCGTAEPPSLVTNHGAEQGFNAVFASHHGSSSSNSLSTCAQSHTISFTDVEPTHVTQAIENPNTFTTVSKVQNQATFQHSVNFSSVEHDIELNRNMPQDIFPDGQSEIPAKEKADKNFTSGALSHQDNNLNVKEIQNHTGPWEVKQTENAIEENGIRSITPLVNIPKSQGKGEVSVEKEEPFLASAINITVQGNDDSNPPASFNNFNNINNISNVVNSSCDCKQPESSSSKFCIQCATLSNKYCASKARKNEDYWMTYFDGPATNARWGIPPGLRLLGGGESSLNSGTSSWGTPSGGNSNNNNSSSSTGGWGGNNQGQGNTAAQNQWGNNNSVNRNSGSGGSGTSQGPSGQQNPGNANKGNNPQSGQPPSQQTQQNQNTSSQQQQQQQQQAQQQQQQQTQQQQQQQNGSTSWAQAAGKGLPASQQSGNAGSSGSNSSNNSSNNNPGAGNNSSSGTGVSGGSSSSGNNSTKQQLEQLNTMREALFSQDGWGGQYVNQDTGWDIPASPEPGVKDGVPVWKPNVNNGTDLWEANLRNGGQPPPSQTQKTPWGHTPTTNIGGTWGEDDDVGDSSNVWTGVPSNTGPGGSGAQWGSNSTGASGGMWGGASHKGFDGGVTNAILAQAGKKDNDWSGAAGSSNWGDPRDPRTDPRSMDPRDPRDPRIGGMDPRDMRGDPRDARMMDPREHMRGVVDPMRDLRDITRMGDIRGGDPMLRDPRGISGRLNGGAGNDGGMWGQPPQPPHHHGPHHQQSQPPGKMVGPGVSGSAVNQWVGPPPTKDLGLAGAGSKTSGWEEPSPPAQRRNIPNYDDGTSLWGNPAQQQNRMGGKVSHWKEMPTPPMGRGGMQCPPGMPQNRMPGNGAGNMKAEGGPLWSHAPRNGSWGDGPHDPVNTGWGDESKTGVGPVNSWNEPPLTPTSWGGPKPKNALNPGWVNDEVEAPWGHPSNKGPKPLTKEFVWSSKQFRILAEMGYKKEDIESALRSSSMSLEDAIEMLNQGRLNVDWRRHEDHPSFDLPSTHPGAGFPGQRFNPVAQPMPFAPPGPGGVSNAPSLINNLSNTSINNISPAIVQKIMAQQPPPQQPPTQQQAPFNQVPRVPQNQPSTAQLRMLVQQIQMAVQAGYLNHQILNQPLAPQTLILLNQLLQQIKVLQQLQQQAVVQPLKGNSSAVLHISVQITKTKQQISNLQNQIASQQAIYVKQQQQQQHHMNPQGPQPGDIFKPNMGDPLSTLQPNFSDLSINRDSQPPTFQGQQSRLNQWKLPDKELDGGTNEFSRAPGTTTKSSLPPSHSSPNINPLSLGQGDGPWSTVTRSNSDGWPEPSNDGTGQPDNKDSWPVTTQQSTAAFTDLVPEFEPGKPWKGTQIKSIEDDPSITPGSVVRSPLSLVTIKDTEIFNAGGSKTSPTVSTGVDTPIPPLSLPSLSSSTWSFNPPSSTAPSFTSPLGKLGVSKGTWGDAPPPTVVTSELWGAPMGKSRGPPPGLSNKNTSGSGVGSSGGTNVSSAGGNSSNGWGSLGTSGAGGSSVSGTSIIPGGNSQSRSSSWGIQGSSAATWGSTWLLLRNLTPQIDGSTLKTLCLQHGPLQSFHLYLNHGIALAKYSTREEANKAQGALNNCVLGNTTIFAESPADSEVHAILQHLGHGAQQQPPGGSAGGWSMRGGSGSSGASKGAPPSDTWAPGGSQLWTPNPSASSLWGSAPVDTSGDQHRATPSSLNSFLPGDLLGGESM